MLKARGYRVTYVGGREPEDSAEAFSHFMNVSLGELRRQASNVGRHCAGRGAGLCRIAPDPRGAGA